MSQLACDGGRNHMFWITIVGVVVGAYLVIAL